MKRTLSMILVLVMLIGLLPQVALSPGAEENEPTENALAGKTLSILGASISTYGGTSNGAAAETTNSTIGSNAQYYPHATVNDVTLNDTWWMQVCNDFGLRLLVNNAWSGSSLLYERNGTVGAYVDRCVQLHDDTGENAGEEPDIIGIQMGTNDFQYYKDTLGTADIDYAALIAKNEDGSYTYAAPTTSLEAAAIVLHKISVRYPKAEVYYLNISQRVDGTDELIRSFNAELKQVVEHFGAHIVDIYGSAITMDDFDTYIGDGRVHPNCLGMDAYTEAFKRALLENTAYAVDTYTVSLDMDGVTADYGDDKIVVSGDSLHVNLTGPDYMDVTVTMGGEDITSAAYADGVVAIDTVTADVTIAATAAFTPHNYRWEFDGTDLTCAEGGNTLTKKAGTTTDGVFSKTCYALKNAVVLQHDLPWAVEWKCEGTFLNTNGSSGARVFTSDNVNAHYNARYIFKSNTNGIVAMGEKTTSGSHNYGIALAEHSIDWTQLHTYRLENRIAEDGTNMVYLFVDGAEIGPMNHYYIGTKDQNTTSDWLSGKDFVFPYMGTDTHGFTNASIDYIQVRECTHSYQNGICTACGAEHPNMINFEGKVISVLGDSISTFAGYIPTADGFNLEHLARYPQDNLLTDVNETWWMQVIAELDAKLGINDSWRGATVSGAKPVTTGTTGENAAMANLTRIQNLGANGTPDVILFYGGTNDLAHVSSVGSFDPDAAPATVDLTTQKWDNLADGYVHTLLRLQYFYPDAQIIAMLPTYTNGYYSNEKLAEGNAVLATICEHYGVSYVDLRDCGISTADLPDNIHPDAAGMDYISAAVIEALLDKCEMEAGENTVHSVTHQLTGAESSLSYYKGVTHGKPFITTITGEDVVVSVTMGGADITDTAYVDGVVTIAEATGDIVITAEGHVKPVYEDHLQQLPSDTCSGTNLWAALEHDQQYYTVNGWGIHSSGTVYSVTFPVSAGDRIYATSFGAAGENGSSINGIRVTWFDDAGLLKTVSADQIYNEFAANGYLTVPEDAAVVSIPMWKVSDANEIYILNRNHTYENGICTGCGDSFAGKTVSILSHSASTYTGVSNGSAYNSTIGNNDVYYTEGKHGVYRKDTWWQQTIDALGMELLVNNSWSGSCVYMPRKGAASVGYGDRAVNLHNDRTGEVPDVIFVYLGCNDFAYYKDTFGTAADVEYAALIQGGADGTFTYAAPQTTCEAYAIMLHKVQTRYPDAQIYCMTSTARRETDYTGDSYPDAGQPTEYSAELQKVAKYFDFPVIDLEKAIPKEIELFDLYMGDKRAHPNALGMDQITNAVLSVMLDAESEICHVTSQDGIVAEQAVLKGGSYSAEVVVPEGFAAVVTMNGKDITAEVCENGKITITEVTGDIDVTTVISRQPMQFAWTMTDGELISDGISANTPSKLAGTVTDGVLNDGRYQLEKAVMLKHDLPWVVEWKCSENWRGVFFSSDPDAQTAAMTYISRVNGGQLCIGTWTGKQYDNYGVDISYLDDQIHAYRLENRIAADGSNMVWLYVDDAEIGPMNNYFIGSKNQNKTSSWISGKDFVFGYIGIDGHALRNCRLEYLQVTECAHIYENGICTGCGAEEVVKALPMRYDDHLDMSGKMVEIIDAGKPNSYQVGYGVEENAVLDTAVVAMEGNYLVATGIGTAKVSIDGQLYEVTVEAAPISLLLLIGQSNMEGNEGDLNQSIVCPDGMVYATYGDRYDMVLENATHYAPSALTGAYRTVNTVGGTDGLADYPVYMLTDEGDGRKGPDSGFAYEWVRQTGEKVWIVNASHGGTSLNVWLPGTTQYEECQAMFGACAETLRREIAAGHFTLSHMAYFWCQGCNDYDKTAQWYVENYLNMHEALKTELAFNHDSNPETQNKTFEFGGIIPVRAGHEWRTYYREGVYTDTTDKSYYESFLDLQMSGPRVAQYWMGNNPELTDIWNVCTIGESWVWMPDGTNGVSEYFQAHYPGGRVDYETQVPQKEAWYTPTTPAAVHDSIHYNQIGYNEVGREAVRNALIYMGVNPDYTEPTTVKFVDWTGYREASQIGACTEVGSATLVVPIVSPITRCKDVTYSLTEGLDYSWYDLTAQAADTVGTLEAVGAAGSVFVEKQKPGALYAEHLSQLPESICTGVNLWTALSHDSQYYTVSGWGVHGSGKVCSVTIPVQAGDRIWATSMGANGVNGNTISTGHGIRVTFFGDYGVIVSMSSTDVYAAFSANGYLAAPEGTTAVNVPMWSDSDQNELYILNLPHSGDGICSICGKDTHEHSWSDWQTVLLPSQDAPGQEQRTCSGCGSTESREVAGVWQTLDLGTYLLELPENTCCSLDLWKVLEHNEYYFHSGVKWAKHESGKIRSVTIPVSEGDCIFATSFGKYGENGNTVSKADGIRCTFFNAYGIAKSTDPAGTYAEFEKNGGYLIAPEGAVAVNVVMWNNSDDNEIYILSRDHCYENGRCAACAMAAQEDAALRQLLDLNGDGEVTAFDAQILAEAKADKRTLTAEQWIAIGILTPQDILNYILGTYQSPSN